MISAIAAGSRVAKFELETHSGYPDLIELRLTQLIAQSPSSCTSPLAEYFPMRPRVLAPTLRSKSLVSQRDLPSGEQT